MATDYIKAGDTVVDLELTAVSSTLSSTYHGTKVTTKKGAIAILIPGVASGAKGAVVALEKDSTGWVTTLMTGAVANLGHPLVAVMCAAADATTKTCWALVKYDADADAEFGVLVDASASADKLMATGSTAGQLRSQDQVPVAGQGFVRGLTLGTAQGGSAGLNTTASWNLLRSTL